MPSHQVEEASKSTRTELQVRAERYEASVYSEIRRALRMAGLAMHHIDGDPLNNDPNNLRIMRLKR